MNRPFARRPGLRIGQQVLQQLSIRWAPPTMKEMYSSASASSRLPILALQHLAVERDHAQRLLQIVAGGIGELVQIVVGLPQRFVGSQQFLVRSATRCSSVALSSRMLLGAPLALA